MTKRPVFRVNGIAISVIVLGVCLQWALLSGSGPWSLFSLFSQGRPDGSIQIHANIQRPGFQTGMVFPRWGTTAYSRTDKNWATGMQEISEQTGSRWLEMTINLSQASATSTQVMTTAMTPSVAALAEGIRAAHARHYHVFIVPLITVGNNIHWSGGVHFQTDQQIQAWFDSYWQVFQPYVIAANQAGAEQLAAGTELTGLENVPSHYWNQLIARIHTIFRGKLTYDMNWTYNVNAFPRWMRNPALSALGVSTYYPLVFDHRRVDPASLPSLWKARAQSYLDTMAIKTGKPVLISEIGYRNSADALFDPWRPDTSALADTTEQAAAFDAALRNAVYDPHIVGVFVWAWSTQSFGPNWLPASQVIKGWYGAING